MGLLMKKNNVEVGAIVVSYNPEYARLLSLCDSLSKQVDVIILVDNGSNNFISEKISIADNVIVISLRENQGIATAQNVGIKKIIDLGLKYVVFFDQDSIVPNGLIGCLKIILLLVHSMDIPCQLLGLFFLIIDFLFITLRSF